MRTIIAELPAKAAYARYMRLVRGAAPDSLAIDPMTGWSGRSNKEPVAYIRARMRSALDQRINIRGGNVAACVPIDYDLVRDARDLDQLIRLRIRCYQFRTAKMRARFGHLLSRHDD